MNIKSILLTVCCSMMYSLAAMPQISEDEQPIPRWFKEHMEYLTKDSGIWIADNSAYKSDSEPYDKYGIKWEWGFGKQTIRGRLFVLQDESEIGSIWEFHTYWHPEKKQVITDQFGSNGVYATGTMDEKKSINQQFFNLDGSTYRTGHRADYGEKMYHSTAYSIDENNEWTKGRTYTWILQEQSEKNNE